MTFVENNPLIGTNFFLDVDGEIISNLMSVDGLAVEVEKTDFNERLTGGKLVQRSTLAKPKNTGDLTLKRLAPLDKTADKLWKWFDDVREGKIATSRKTGSILIYDHAMAKTLAKWNFKDAFPTKIAQDGVDVTKNDAVTETITLAYGFLDRKQ